jgi:hypothetical protein
MIPSRIEHASAVSPARLPRRDRLRESGAGDPRGRRGGGAKGFDAFRDDWNGPGFPNLETLLKPNADFVVVTGKWLKGRESIVAYHRRLLQTFYAGTMRDKPSDGPPSPR